jgi:hypothetical protein
MGNDGADGNIRNVVVGYGERRKGELSCLYCRSFRWLFF